MASRHDIISSAAAFAVWRAAEAADWAIRPEEIAAAIGVPVARTRTILARRGWMARLDFAGAMMATDAVEGGALHG